MKADCIDKLCALITHRGNMRDLYNQIYYSELRVQLATFPDPNNDTDLERMAEYVETQFERARIQHGESIGISTAQSIGEKITQLTLNTFHQSGETIELIDAGIPRFIELTGTNKTQRLILCKATMAVVPPEELSRADWTRELRLWCDQHLVEAYVRDFVETYQLNCDSAGDWIHIARNLGYITSPTYTESQLHIIHNTTPRLAIRFVLKRKSIVRYQYTPLALLKLIFDKWIPPTEDILSAGLASPVYIHEFVIYIWSPLELSIYSMEAMICTRIIFPMLDMFIKGIRGCTGFVILSDKSAAVDKSAATAACRTPPLLTIIGGNLNAIYRLPEIDSRRTISNNLWEIYDLYGIEFLREFLIQEMIHILSSDSFVNRRHIYLLADVMTYYGFPISITRYGMRYLDTAWLSKATFEETMDIITSAAYHEEVDPLDGNSASIMVGRLAPAGTGSVYLHGPP